MRICLLSARFPPQLCGIGDYTYFLGTALARMGNEVHVLTAVGELDLGLYPVHPNLRVHRTIGTWSLRGLPSVIRWLRDLQPEVLVIEYVPHAFGRRGITFAVNLLPAILRLATRIRVVTNFHELFIPFDRSLKHFLGAVWQRAMAFLIAAPSHTITAISSEWPRRLRRVGVWKQIRVIPVGSNIPRADVGAHDLQAVRGTLGAGPSTLLIGCFGSAGPDRDIQLLLEAVRRLRWEQSVKLVWLGSSGAHGERSTGLHQAPQGGEDGADIVWTGPLPHPEVSCMMAACDLFVLPFTDGISTKRGTLAAALLHGLPVLTTRGKRVDDVFVHRENVYLVPMGDARALVDGLSELARCTELRTRLARGARALYDAHLAWDVIAEQVASVQDRSRS